MNAADRALNYAITLDSRNAQTSAKSLLDANIAEYLRNVAALVRACEKFNEDFYLNESSAEYWCDQCVGDAFCEALAKLQEGEK